VVERVGILVRLGEGLLIEEGGVCRAFWKEYGRGIEQMEVGKRGVHCLTRTCESEVKVR